MLAERAERPRKAPIAVLLRSGTASEEEGLRGRDAQERTVAMPAEDRRARTSPGGDHGLGSTFQTILRVTTPRIVVEGIGEVQIEGDSKVVLFSSVRRRDEAPVATKTVHGNISGFGIAESIEDNVTR